MYFPIFALLILSAQETSLADRMCAEGLTHLHAYHMLDELTNKIGGRLSGSPQAARAVTWADTMMRSTGLENVKQIPCMVPHWVRGKQEVAILESRGKRSKLSICALGGSVGTPKGGIDAEIVEVKTLAEASALGERGRGKIVFFNRGFDPTLTSTFRAYGGAVDQRFGGASAAAKSGAVAVLVRSMTLDPDDEPHTGVMEYGAGDHIPAAALGIKSANRLSDAVGADPHAKAHLELSCETLPDEPSANVVGEIVGSEKPDEVIVLGGHLDSWDLGRGAHDDGAGVVQAIEALRLLKSLGLKPKRTIRAIAFMNEENGSRGAKAYAEFVKNGKQKAYAAVESDSGGFMPRAFGVPKEKLDALRKWEDRLQVFGIEHFRAGGGGADIEPLAPLGAALFGLEPENQRYFDYHHSRKDTLDKVNPRELEFGAMAMGMLAWLISEEGLPN